MQKDFYKIKDYLVKKEKLCQSQFFCENCPLNLTGSPDSFVCLELEKSDIDKAIDIVQMWTDEDYKEA